jgi:hypothetical protein
MQQGENNRVCFLKLSSAVQVAHLSPANDEEGDAPSGDDEKDGKQRVWVVTISNKLSAYTASLFIPIR